jgi:long-chain acyl-CoA synthetase
MTINRLFDLVPHYLEKFDWKQDVFAAKESGEWKKYSANHFVETVTNLSYGLINSGLQRGDKVATISNNRPEWNFTDHAIMQSGGIHVPIYPTITSKDYEYIFNHAEVKFVFVSGIDMYNKIKDILPNCKSVKKVFSFDKIEEATNYKLLIEEGQQNPQADKLNIIRDSITTNDIATLIYTSGTTGNMKGVMLTHLNIISNFLALTHLPPTGSEGKALSYLPLCHIFERMVNYLFQYMGISVYYAENIGTIADNLKEIKPEIMTSVPRLIEKVFDKIKLKGSKLSGISKVIFDWSLKLGFQWDDKGNNGSFYMMKLAIARKLVFKKWQEALGGNIKVIIIGGAALQKRLGKVFNAAGVPMLEGYGLTETSPVLAVNDWGKNNSMIGTVGPIIKNVKIKIAEDGEILAKGPNVMQGYYKDKELSQEVLTDDGWFHTGDLGELVENKFLRITGRKKDLLKTSFGKYIAPSLVERKMQTSAFIDNIVVVGDNQKFAGAIILPNFEQIKDWCKIEGKDCPPDNEIIEFDEVKKLFSSEINKINKELADHEKVKTFRLVADEWDISSGLVTAKMSIKRKEICERYAKEIEEMFG